ncbi:MAG: alpha-ketoglutarate-dependent dioxygenase AlkB [Proteobacteria bacterium ST_bin11]|nr:MAG: alpha-ketoglutarate-dependent dioxygenase AlkB [Proteobacteria bacterium ST_bin11]
MTSPSTAFANQQNLVPSDGELYLLQGFYPQSVADNYLQSLLRTLAWQTEQIHLYGRWLLVPRLMAWYGDPGADYRYSGVDHPALPWTSELQTLRTEVQAACQTPFNSVLANLYRDGRDSRGCHADNEKELGENPLIASLSFGETRLLRLRHPRSHTTLDLRLSHGDLLVMAGELQHHWRHELPKTRQAKQARINLTFRRVLSTPISPARSAMR